MSQKIRQGNDIRIRWSILDADEHPYILEGRNVAVELNVGTKRVRIKSLEIESNVLIFTYYGKDQKYTGSYILKFIENEGQVDMVTFDTKDAFTLVEHSWQAIDEGETPETVQLEFVTVSSELMEKVGPAGPHFTPSVDGEGNLSWTNNGGLPNPETVNIKGPKGDDAAVVPGEGQKSAQQRESGAVASGEGAFAEGDGVASGAYSHAEGFGTEATHNEGEHAEGRWNKSNADTISSIGIGTSANARANAVEVMKNGDMYVKGVGGYDGTNPGAAQDMASVIASKQATLESGTNIKTINNQSIIGSGNIEIQGGSDDAVLYTPQVLTNSQKNQARENIETVGATVVSSITPAEQYVSQELMNLLAFAPTMKVKWNHTNDDGVTNKRILVNHPLMNYEDAEIVLLSYAKHNGGRKKIPSPLMRYKKGYCVAYRGYGSYGNYFTFSATTSFDSFVAFISSFGDGSPSGTVRKRAYGIALRIPNPAYSGPETPNKNNTYHGVPESIWSAVLRVGIYFDDSHDTWGIGII